MLDRTLVPELTARRPAIRASVVRGLPLARRLLGYLVPHRRLVAVAALCAAVESTLALVPLVVLKLLVDRLRAQHPDVGALVPLVVLGTAAGAAIAMIGVASTYLLARITEGVVCDLRDQLFGNLIDQTVGFWVRRRGGEMTSRILNDVGAIDNLLASASLTLFGSLLRAIGLTVLLFVLDWRLAILVLVLLPFLAMPIRRAGRRIGVARLRVQEQLATVTGYLQEVLSVSGAELVRAHNRRAHERDRFAELNRELRRREVAAAMSARWFSASVAMLASAGPAVVLLAGAYLVVHEHVSVGTVLVISLVVTTQLGGTLQNIGNTVTALLASLPVWRRIFAALDERPEIGERPGAITLAPSELAGAIELEHVSFTYPGQNRPAIDDVTVTIPSGQLVAIVGPTGAGKSTLGMLVARMTDPQTGIVHLDDHDLRDLTLDTVAGATGIVFQDSFLFHSSLGANLRYARPEATDEELWNAIRSAQLEDVVAALPNGLDTIVGERGHKLSGGERQRMAIARAMLEDPPVLILDEATSHLDLIVERHIQEALERRLADRTRLIIAHRLSTIQNADLILVMDAGQIVERGTHDQLIDAGGLYSRLYEAQASAASSSPPG